MATSQNEADGRCDRQNQLQLGELRTWRAEELARCRRWSCRCVVIDQRGVVDRHSRFTWTALCHDKVSVGVMTAEATGRTARAATAIGAIVVGRGMLYAARNDIDNRVQCSGELQDERNRNDASQRLHAAPMLEACRFRRHLHEF